MGRGDKIEVVMPNETRVNLKHLLEDLRDVYASPINEVIVTELIANALDSGASRISLEACPSERFFRCVDNGCGMNRVALRSYHNIAASTKERGAGIGFAGVGAKLSLLVAQKVITESRGKHGAQGAAEWYLKNAYRAPWKFIPFSGLIENGKGTAVTIYLSEEASSLLDVSFLVKTVQRHYYPLLTRNEAIGKILKTVYKKPVEITVNGQPVRVEQLAGGKSFFVHVGKNRRAIGAGIIEKTNMDEGFWSRLFGHEATRSSDTGLRISTYGKVIRGGWEWLGISVTHPELLSGVVEVPGLSEILTTNKSDFLTTQGALKKYYEIRKTIQRAVLPALREFGEVEEKTQDRKTPSAFKPLTADIEGALSLMSETFPELESLVGEHWRRMKAIEGKGKKGKEQRMKISSVSGVSDGQGRDLEEVNQERGESHKLRVAPEGDHTKRERHPGIEIVFEPFAEEGEQALLGKLVDEKITINTSHPAWRRAQALAQEPYHVLLTVALILGEHVQSPQGMNVFVSEFLKAWSEASAKSGRLL